MDWDWPVAEWLAIATQLWTLVNTSTHGMINLLLGLFMSAGAIFMLWNYIRGSDTQK